MHLFLHGQMRIGKSSLLRDTLRTAAPVIAGFMTQRLIENGKTIGYRALRVSDPLPPLEIRYENGLDGIFLLRGHKDISVLEKMIVQTEQDSQRDATKLIILDEIGGIELTSYAFMDPLRRILSGTKPCVGVLKSTQNLAHTASVLHLGKDYFDFHQQLKDLICSNGELLLVTNENRENLRDYLKKYMKSHCGNVTFERICAD